MQRNKHQTTLALIGAVLIFAACAGTTLIGHSEQGLSGAVAFVDPLIQADYDQAAACRTALVPVGADCSPLEKLLPGAHATANKIRQGFPPAERAANAALGVARDAQKIAAALAANPTATDAQKAAAAQAVQAAIVDLGLKVAAAVAYGTEANAVLTAWKTVGGGK